MDRGQSKEWHISLSKLGSGRDTDFSSDLNVVEISLAELAIHTNQEKASDNTVFGGFELGRRPRSVNNRMTEVMDSPVVSRLHAKLVLAPDRSVYIVDMDSLHGTRIIPVSGDVIVLKRFMPCQLLQGDIIVFGRAVVKNRPVRLVVSYKNFKNNGLSGKPRSHLPTLSTSVSEHLIVRSNGLAGDSIMLPDEEISSDNAHEYFPGFSVPPPQAPPELNDSPFDDYKDTPYLAKYSTIFTAPSSPTYSPVSPPYESSFPRYREVQNGYGIDISLLYDSEPDESLPRGESPEKDDAYSEDAPSTYNSYGDVPLRRSHSNGNDDSDSEGASSSYDSDPDESLPRGESSEQDDSDSEGAPSSYDSYPEDTLRRRDSMKQREDATSPSNDSSPDEPLPCGESTGQDDGDNCGSPHLRNAVIFQQVRDIYQLALDSQPSPRDWSARPDAFGLECLHPGRENILERDRMGVDSYYANVESDDVAVQDEISNFDDSEVSERSDNEEVPDIQERNDDENVHVDEDACSHEGSHEDVCTNADVCYEEMNVQDNEQAKEVESGMGVWYSYFEYDDTDTKIPVANTDQEGLQAAESKDSLPLLGNSLQAGVDSPISPLMEQITESPTVTLALASEIPVASRPRTPSLSDGSDVSMCGPFTPPSARKRSLSEIEPDVIDSLEVSELDSKPTTLDESNIDIKVTDAEQRPVKRARPSLGQAIGLVVLGAALGSVGTIAGLMQLAD